MATTRRTFLGALGTGVIAAAGGGATSAQTGRGAAGSGEGRPPSDVPVRTVKTTPLFKSPEAYPNAIAIVPEGLWIAEQKTDNAHLVDWNGNVLKTVRTESKNTSGLGFGGGYVWMGANAAPQGVFQTDLASRTVSHRQIPLGPHENGGGCHGIAYVDGKLWIAALRLRGILRVDAQTWAPEMLIPYSVPRAHGVAWDGSALWMVTGDADGAGLIKYDAVTGRTLEIARFAESDCDPHGLAFRDGVLYSCDAGIHPGWPENKSPTHGYIFRIDLL